MDIVVIILIAVALFGLALVGSKAYGMLLVWKKARSFGLAPNIGEIVALTKFYSLEEDFLKACARFKSLDPTISLKDIVKHHMADGDTLQLLDKWSQLKKNDTDTIPFKSAVLYDLSGKDLNQVIDDQQKVFEITLPKIEENHVCVEYLCRLKIDTESAGWITPNLKSYEEIIEDKIKLAVLAGDTSNHEVLSNFIKSQYLNDKFWKELCHGIVIKQELNIKNQ